jgi:hypothetical protein
VQQVQHHYQYCINRYTNAATTGATGIGTATGLPAGVTAAFASNTIQLVVHQLYRNIQLYSTDRWVAHECRNDYSNTKTTLQVQQVLTLCISTVLTDITHATTGATGIGTAGITSRSYRSICFEYHYN